MLALVFVAVLAVDQLHVVLGFSRLWANEDHTLLWYATHEVIAGRWHEPMFYGQSYSTIFAAVPAAGLALLRVRNSTGEQLSGALLMTACWLVLAVAAALRGHRLMALVALAAPVLLASEYGVWGSMQARAPGALLATAGVALLVTRPQSRAALFGFSVLGGLGLAWDSGSVFLVAPAAVYAVVLHHRSLGTLAIGAAGLVPAAAYALWSARFIAERPDYDLHPSPNLLPDPAVLGETLPHLDRYWSYLAPELLPWWPIPLLVLALLVGALLLTRRARFVLPALAAVAVTAVVFATPKAMDGRPSVFLSYGRLIQAVAVMTFFLGVLVAEAGGFRLSRRVAVGAATALLVAALATFGVRLATFDVRYGAMADAAIHSAAPISNVDTISNRCNRLSDAARASRADLVVFRYDRTAAYACAAQPQVELNTLFPEYERRTWLLHEDNHVARTRFLVTEVDIAWCRAARAHVQCTMDSRVPDVALIEMPAQPVVPVLRQLGLPVRSFDPAPAG